MEGRIPIKRKDPGQEDDEAYTLGPANPESSSPPRLSQDHSPLLHFGPAATSTDTYDRPKTSRGPGQELDTMPGAFPESNSQRSARATRRSKFNEGSMNERSTAVSSSWDEYGPRVGQSSDLSAEEDADSDATPRASRMSRG